MKEGGKRVSCALLLTWTNQDICFMLDMDKDDVKACEWEGG